MTRAANIKVKALAAKHNFDFIDLNAGLADTDGNLKKELTFDSVLPRSLKMHAYLKVGYNDKRQQVINWEKVDQKDIPQAALNRIN